MATLAESKADVVEALEAQGIPSSPFMPENIYPPIALMGAGSPYIEPESFEKFKPGKYTVRLEITLVTALTVNEQTVSDCDDLIEKALSALNVLKDWNIESVSEPGILANTSSMLAVNIIITNRLEVN